MTTRRQVEGAQESIATRSAEGPDVVHAERIVVCYAQGIVMSELHCSSDEASSLLMELARQEGGTVESVACAVVERSLARPLDEVLSRKRELGSDGADD